MINQRQTIKLLDSIRDKQNVSVFGLSFYSRPIALNPLSKYIYVAPDFVKATEIFDQISSIRSDAVYLPPLFDCLSTKKQSKDNTFDRINALFKAVSGQANIIVTSALALMQLYPSAQDILSHSIKISKNQSIDTDHLAEKLSNAGYKRVSHVEEVGEFSIRGDICDILPISQSSNLSQKGIRIDFFGDTVEKIRQIDFESLSSQQQVEFVFLSPAKEVFATTDQIDKIAKILNSTQQKNLEPEHLQRQKSIASDLVLSLEGGTCDPAANALKPVLDQHPLHKLFLNRPIIFDESRQCVSNFNAHLSEHLSRFKTLLSKGEAFSFFAQSLFVPDFFAPQSHPQSLISFDNTLVQNRIFTPDQIFSYKNPTLPSYFKNHQGLIDDIKMWQRQGAEVSIHAKSALKDNLSQLLQDHSICPSIIVLSPLLKGGCFFGDDKKNETNRIIIANGDLVAKSSTDNHQSRTIKSKKQVFFEPKIGQAVVHSLHGIGMCEGLKRMKLGPSEKDFIVVAYQGNDKLYVATESINLLSAYAGGEENPKLNKIGGADFSKHKEKAKNSIKAMAFDLTKLYAKRQEQKGHFYEKSNADMFDFEQDFPFDETDCQLEAIKEGIADLTNGKIMDRLLCGDVGYGKTEVAMRIIYKVVLEGHQAAFVSPTTILANQHTKSLKKRMEKFGVKVASLTRFDSPQKVQSTLKGLADGTIDVVCGTHRALSKDVIFKNLGLLVLDEEQRFGVADKE
ncbi:MAG: DEAD/DEAH box helicase, partial [Firmicutes bacterium]|nr:DEAD/DEAH box helicase [Bacillota bacterium]